MGITDDAHAVNNKEGFEQYQTPRNIALTGLEAKRKYDITFDTKKSPGKICIELKEHKISTLDGWLFSGTPVEMEVSKYEHGGLWPINTEDGAVPLKKTGNNTWTVTVTAKKGWNGFKLCTQNWLDEIAWSGFDWEDPWKMYGGISGSNVFNYSLEDDDTIKIGEYYYFVDGTEKVTLTFGINNGRVTCEMDIEYTKEFDLNKIEIFDILSSEKEFIPEYNVFDHRFLLQGDVGSDKSFSFSISEPSGILRVMYPDYEEHGEGWYQVVNYQRFESVEVPSGVKQSCREDGGWGILLTGLVPEKTYNVKLTKGDKTGYFKIIITAQ